MATVSVSLVLSGPGTKIGSAAIIADALSSLHYALMNTQIGRSDCGESGDHG